MEKTKTRIREYRDRSRLTLDELSILTGLDKSTISKHESGDRIPSKDAVRRYCKVFKCESHELLGFELPEED